jgi:hypothetical protein
MQRPALLCLLLLAPVACSQALFRQLPQVAQLQTCRSSCSLVARVLVRKAVYLFQQAPTVVILVLLQQQPTVSNMLAGLVHHLEHLPLQTSALQRQLAAVAGVQCLMLRELSAATQLLLQA